MPTLQEGSLADVRVDTDLLALQETSLADVRVDTELPPLAWLAEVSDNDVRLWCGDRVEVREDGFFEGCWADDFANFNFDEVANVFGSGGKISGNGVLFVTPSHTLEGLYVLDKEGRIVVSNSLPFLLNVENLDLEFDFDIGNRFASILKGTAQYERVLFRGAGWTLYRIFRENIEVCSGRMTLKTVKQDAPFTTFEEYKSYLLTTIRKTFENGGSPLRATQFSPIATCSNGYDSPTCAALAASLGCDQALSLTTARGGRADSGRDIAERLGMKVHEFQREGKSTDRAFGEAEFLASGMGGEDYALGVLGPFCAGKIVVNGFLGGTMWQLDYAPTTVIVRKDCSGSNMTEHRLRHGFVLLPVPFIGSTHHDHILRISKGAEMAAYRIGGDYDRPIPRRILEEQGISREAFGQVKKGYSICFNYSSMWWSPIALADLKDFERRVMARRPDRGRYLLRRVAHTAVVFGFYLALKICRSAGVAWVPRSTIKLLIRDFPSFEHNHPRYGGVAFLWALAKVRSRYPLGEVANVAR
jgi:hypothetical protein